MKYEVDSIDESVVTLDTYNSDLNLVIDASKYSAQPLTKEGFAFMWAGARASHGATKGKFCFEVKVIEYLDVSHLPADEPNPHVVRVGFSVDSSTLQLGEDPLSYGYGGTGKISTNCQFKDFGPSFMAGDCILAVVDMDSDLIQIGFAKNGNFVGWAYKVRKNELQGKALFPHVLTKNCSFEVNFGQRDQPFFKLPDATKNYTFVGCLPMDLRVAGSRPPTSREACEMIMMCGLPGAGKSVWAADYSQKNPDKKYNVLGTNNIIDKMKVMGLPRKRNYAGRWDVLIQMATKCLNSMFSIGSKLRRNYILDQTNVYPTAQRRKMRNFDGFKRIAVVVVPTEAEYKKRCDKRDREEGKEIPDSAVLEMKANFKLPEVSDIFDEVKFTELQREEAEKLVKQYNEEGKAAMGPARKQFRPNEPMKDNKGFDNRKGNFGGYSNFHGDQGMRGGPNAFGGNRGDYGRGSFNNRGGFNGGRGNRGGGYDSGFGGRDNMRGGYDSPGSFGDRGSFDSNKGGRESYDSGYSSSRGGFDSNRNSGRGGFDDSRGGRGSFDGSRGSGRGGFDSGRGGSRGGFDNSRGSGRGGYDTRGGGRGGYDSSRGSGRGGYDSGSSRGSYDSGNSRGGYDSGRGGRGSYDSNRGGRGGSDGNRGGGRGGYDGSRGSARGSYDGTRGGGRSDYDSREGYDNRRDAYSTYGTAAKEGAGGNYAAGYGSDRGYDKSSRFDQGGDSYRSDYNVSENISGSARRGGYGYSDYGTDTYGATERYSDAGYGNDSSSDYDRGSANSRFQSGSRGAASRGSMQASSAYSRDSDYSSGYSAGSNSGTQGSYSRDYSYGSGSYGDFKSPNTADSYTSRDTSSYSSGSQSMKSNDPSQRYAGSVDTGNKYSQGTGYSGTQGRTTRWSAETPQTASSTDAYSSNRSQSYTYQKSDQSAASYQGKQSYGYQQGMEASSTSQQWMPSNTSATSNPAGYGSTQSQWMQYGQQMPNQYYSQ